MISYIQNKLQKHNKIFFFTLLAVIIVAFVFTVGDAPGLGGADRVTRNEFFGYNLASERDIREISRTGQLSYRLTYGEEMPDPDRFQNFALERIAFLGLADQLRIPGPTDDELHHFIATRQVFQDGEGRFDRQRYSNFIDEVDADPQISTGDIALVMDQDFRIEKARELVSGPGYILPTEVRLQLERNQTLWTLDLATVNLAEFDPEIEVSDEELQTFFEENSFRYEREPRVSFSYAHFSRDSFLDRVRAPSENDLQRHFEQHRDRFVALKAERDAANENAEEEAATPSEVILDDVRSDVEESLRKQRARRLAGEAAADFAYALFLEQEARPSTERFNELLAEHQGELREAPPASQSEFPPQLRFPREAQQRVFRLTEERDFSEPLAVQDDHIVLIYHETLPSYLPPLEDVRDRVERDYKSQERRRLVSEKGQQLRETLQSRMADGATFQEAAEGEGLTVQSAEKFSRINPPAEINQQLVARLDEFKRGEVSSMISQGAFGFLVYLRDREKPEIDQTGSEFVRTEENLRSWSSMVNQHYVLDEFIRRATETN